MVIPIPWSVLKVNEQAQAWKLTITAISDYLAKLAIWEREHFHFHFALCTTHSSRQHAFPSIILSPPGGGGGGGVDGVNGGTTGAFDSIISLEQLNLSLNRATAVHWIITLTTAAATRRSNSNNNDNWNNPITHNHVRTEQTNWHGHQVQLPWIRASMDHELCQRCSRPDALLHTVLPAHLLRGLSGKYTQSVASLRGLVSEVFFESKGVSHSTICRLDCPAVEFVH